jgi:prepilin-type N-terminal cleavage/methylation domain-containing protein
MMTKRKGFTLVELLVAISILAVLIAVLLPNLMGVRDKAKDSQRVQDLNTLKNSLRMYYDDKQTYVFTSGEGSEEWSDLESGCTGCLSDLVTLGYLPSLQGIGYSYATTKDGDGFRIWTVLKASTGDDDIESQAKCGVGTTVNNIFMVCAN